MALFLLTRGRCLKCVRKGFRNYADYTKTRQNLVVTSDTKLIVQGKVGMIYSATSVGMGPFSRVRNRHSKRVADYFFYDYYRD